MKKNLFFFIVASLILLVGCGGKPSIVEPTITPTPVPIGTDEDLAAIISSAQEGDTLYLGEGTYHLLAGMTIQKSLTIIGAGMDKTIITNDTPVSFIRKWISDEGEEQGERFAMFNFDAEGIFTLKGLTLSFSGTDPSYVLSMNNGDLELENCKLTSSSQGSEEVKHYPILILNNNNIAHINNCILEGSDTVSLENEPNGIVIAINSQIDVTDSQISNVYFGIITNNSSSVTLNGNTFSSIGEYAVLIQDSSSLSANHNTLNGNGEDWGFVCTDGQNMVLEENTIKNTNVGIYFDNNCSGQVRKNNITDSKLRGVNSKGSATVTVEENTLSNEIGTNDNQNLVGIYFEENSSGNIVKNIIDGFYFGIDAQGSAALTVAENTINKGEYSIAFFDNSSGTVQSNVINNSVAGIFAKGSSNVTVENNTITGDGIFENKAENSQGITFIDGSLGTAINNQVSGYYYGFLTNSLLTVQLQGNTITSCKYGMRFDEFSVNTTATGNKISQCETGIWVNNKATPILDSNEIFSNTNAFRIEKTSNPLLKENNVHDNTYNE